MNPRLSVALHVLAQILALGAVKALIPPSAEPYFMAVVAIVGVVAAFSDQTVSKEVARRAAAKPQ